MFDDMERPVHQTCMEEFAQGNVTYGIALVKWQL